ncbi:MAG: peptidoglycan-binding protein [Candidatus Omnitrophica bacterium]|nr:peptidoglycan-binding protein [Candidatus Omnitrophota bacterium]
MKKIISSLLIFSWIVLIAAPPAITYAAVAVPITASSAVLLEQPTQRLVFSKTPNLRRAPASTTKILTAIVAMDLLSLDAVVRIPSFAEKIEPSKIHLRTGERYYARDLIKATLMSSANDAAEVLAVAAAGSRVSFAAHMNRKVKAIGAYSSHFVNASGLPANGQYSTAYDMARIMKEACRYPFIVQTMRTRTAYISSLRGRRIFLKNHNKMLWRDSREVIGKTGWTRHARHCFVGEIRVAARNVVVSMLGSHRLWKDLKILVDYQFGKSITRKDGYQKIASREKTKRVQLALKHAGYFSGPITGYFGSLTRRALKRFQAAKGLEPDGIVGPKTWKKLESFI